MGYLATILYSRIVNGITTNSWTSLEHDGSYSEPGWGDPSTYQIVSLPMSQSEDPNWVNLRSKRDLLLSESDWTQLSDSPLSFIDKSSCAIYRQALRDLPDKTLDPTNASWPAIPSVLG